MRVYINRGIGRGEEWWEIPADDIYFWMMAKSAGRPPSFLWRDRAKLRKRMPNDALERMVLRDPDLMAEEELDSAIARVEDESE